MVEWNRCVGQERKVMKKWARQYECCINCGTTDRKHCGLGLCELCYSRKLRKNKGQIVKYDICKHKFIDGQELVFCRHCQQWKKIECFQKGTRRRDGLKSFCKDCENQYYRGKRSGIDSRQTERRRKRREERILQVLSDQNNGCYQCGTYYDISSVYEFHHLDSSQKEYRVAQLIGQANDRWLTEIEKCILVCSNCHRIIHRGVVGGSNPDYYKTDRYGVARKNDVERRRHRSNVRKQEILAKQQGCFICKCIYDYMGVYDFHHLESSTKERGMARILVQANDGWKTEVKKCILVCSNCHRMIHALGLEKVQKELEELCTLRSFV